MFCRQHSRTSNIKQGENVLGYIPGQQWNNIL